MLVGGLEDCLLMSKIKLKSLKIKNYRSFGNQEQLFDFTKATQKKLPLAITGYNNVGKTNLMNAILFGVGQDSVSEDTFELHDLFNLDFKNNILIETGLEVFKKVGATSMFDPKSLVLHKIETTFESEQIKSSIKPSFFGDNKRYQVFYINFHKIKDEICTQKSNWGNLKSFLAKHIKKLVDEDEKMKSRKNQFQSDIKKATDLVLKSERDESSLSKFIQKIKANYSSNLRDNNCEIDFGLPDYEDIFLQMVFKIGLNGNTDKLVPIDHFGDGYISMFVMAVIQAIAEENTGDECLFLFEEPESFLHENRQEYFYKMVLCQLAKKGHQVIYTTHSDKMVDITKPDSLIRLRFENGQTTKAFPIQEGENPLETKENLDAFPHYNEFIKTIEPGLNKILFSEKVILVEGPNDLLVYKFLIEQRARQKADKEEKIKDKENDDKENWAKTYLNFNNIAIIPHHGKATAYLLAKLCKYLGVDYYLINDWDFDESDLDLNIVATFKTEKALKESDIYKSEENSNKKGVITTNWKLLNSAINKQIHFNVKKLETVIGYESDNKNPIEIWAAIQKYKNDEITQNIFPKSLDDFTLGLTHSPYKRNTGIRHFFP